MESKQNIYFYFDDSGVLHKNSPSRFFVYAGYVFTDKKELNIATRKYVNANKKIKEATGKDDELKAFGLENRYRRALFNSVREYNKVYVVVRIDKVYDHILASKNSICRFKDYALKRCIKDAIKKLIADGKAARDRDTHIRIYIDEQLTATNGYYDLRDSIKEELQYGIENFNYGIRHPNVFDSNVIVDVRYCDSKNNYMIQACDILANRVLNAYLHENYNLLKMPNYNSLTLP